MLLKRLDGLLVVVLAANGQQHAAFGQGKQVLLEGLEGFAAGRGIADFDAVQTVVADHPAPQGVVQVQHRHFLGRLAEVLDQVGRFAGHVQHQPAAIRLLALKPAPRIPGLQRAAAGGKKFDVADMHIGGGGDPKLQVDQLAEAPVRGEGAGAVGARVEARGQGEVHQDDFRPGPPIGGDA